MFMAIAVETPKHPINRTKYNVWYLEMTDTGQVVGMGVKTRENLVESLFKNYKSTGKSNWRAFCKESESSKAIELYDFIAQGMNENTHFGNLPTLHEFQKTIDALELNLEIRPMAC